MSMLPVGLLMTSAAVAPDCPHLAELRPPEAQGSEDPALQWVRTSSGVSVRVLDSHALFSLSEHFLAGEPSCEELARLSRVLLEIWANTRSASKPEVSPPRGARAVRAPAPEDTATGIEDVIPRTEPQTLGAPARLELSVLGGGTLSGRSLATLGGAIFVRYRPWERLAFELGGLRLGTRTDRYAFLPSELRPGPLPEDNFTTAWAAFLGAEVTLLRVPATLFAALGSHLGLFANAGLGVAGVSSTEVLQRTAGSSGVRPAVSLGLGAEFAIWGPSVTLRGELRDVVFADPTSSGLTHDWQTLVGLGFALDPAIWESSYADSTREDLRRGHPLRLQAGVGFTPADTLVSSLVLSASLQYWVHHMLALELRGAGLMNEQSSLQEHEGAAKLRRPAALSAQMVGNVSLGPRVAILRSSLWGENIAARVDVFGGLGLAGTRYNCLRQELPLDPERFGAGQSCGPFEDPDSSNPQVHTPVLLAFTGNFGTAVEFEINQSFSVGLEVRNHLFWASMDWPTEPSESSAALRQIVAFSLQLGLLL